MPYKMVEPPNPQADVKPEPPASPASDADRPRWTQENRIYLEKLGAWQERQRLKIENPELEGKSWH